MHRFFAASMSRGLLAVWSLTLAIITQGGAQATPCSIWYAPETQLPSTLGLTDTPLAPADVESSAFSVSGGFLRLDTIATPGDSMAYYQLTNGFDQIFDNPLTMRLKVAQMCNSFGLMVGVNDAA